MNVQCLCLARSPAAVSHPTATGRCTSVKVERSIQTSIYIATNYEWSCSRTSSNWRTRSDLRVPLGTFNHSKSIYEPHSGYPRIGFNIRIVWIFHRSWQSDGARHYFWMSDGWCFRGAFPRVARVGFVSGGSGGGGRRPGRCLRSCSLSNVLSVMWAGGACAGAGGGGALD